MPHLDKEELKKFKYAGKNVLVSSLASIHNPGNISIGDYSRIDDFCILSAGEGGITIGRNVHIAVYVSLIGKEKIQVDDFAGISSRTSVYSSNDDYSGNFMTGPTVDAQFTNVTHGSVHIGKHAVIGAGCVILPSVNIMEGAIVGALSLVKKDCESFGIYIGAPAKKVSTRSNRLLKLEEEFLKTEKQKNG
jgi:acetyltransferase-like isoleucine patch superfamily enzyme